MKKLCYEKLVSDLIELSWKEKNPHMNSALSCLPIVVECYNKNPQAIFILSKGHAYFAQVVVLRELGFNPSITYTHPEQDLPNGIWCRTGSLGHGLPIAIGLAMAYPKRHVDCVLGDNECMEGTFWESLNCIQAFNVRNITVHIDCNGRGATDFAFNRITNILNESLPFVVLHRTRRGMGNLYAEQHPDWHKHDLTAMDMVELRKGLCYAKDVSAAVS